MKLLKKLTESILSLNGEPNLIPPDNSNEFADNYFIVNVFNNLLHSVETAFDCIGADVSDGLVSVYITDGESVTELDFFDEDGVPYLTVSEIADDEEDMEDEDEEAFDISGLGIFDGVNFDFTKLDKSFLDYFAEVPEDSELSEASIVVIRGGKKVKKKLFKKKRKKVLSGKRKLAIKRGVIKRKRSMRKSLIKRKKSLAIRKRSKLKEKPKNFKVR